MININGLKIELKQFPDHTQNLRIPEEFYNNIATKTISNNSQYQRNTYNMIKIEWLYESDSELVSLIFLTKHLKDQRNKIKLILPYIPNARMDRVNNADEIFTLKYFASIINSLNFEEVWVLDAHSSVALALIDRVKKIPVQPFIEKAIKKSKPTLLFMPDEGAYKRYNTFPNFPATFGIKHRDWRTGNILNYEISEPELVKNKKILIIDDISSKGGTFYHAAKSLLLAGAKEVNLYITHTEKTIEQGELLKENSPIKNIYTANPLFEINSFTTQLNKIQFL
ncbi:ribose-phosphate pyrophosphokinase [Lactococcus lactis subsp. lactis]|uniref:hypothetical protein n=1 Tax=Lactococcus lactis TaxID=1358 RepID=UPI00223A9EFA|nr:hypothetical protein [Lactococcus lactis]MCT0017719.1 ribose-phosphate pyrophosphokinase [Lactococcus lactis subsp. lactis]